MGKVVDYKSRVVANVSSKQSYVSGLEAQGSVYDPPVAAGVGCLSLRFRVQGHTVGDNRSLA